MTARSVLKLARHYAKMIVIITVVCIALGVAFGVARASLGNQEYTAESTLTISEPTGLISASELMPLARAVAANVVAEEREDGVSLSYESVLVDRAITFVAAAPTEKLSIETANAAAKKAAEEVSLQLGEMAASYRDNAESTDFDSAKSDTDVLFFKSSQEDRAIALEMVSFTVNDASQALVNSGRSSAVKFGMVGFVGGLIVSLCALVLINYIRRPVMDGDELERSFGIPVLAKTASDNFGARLWANIKFSAESVPSSICLIPTGEDEEPVATDPLVEAIALEGGHVERLEPARYDSMAEDAGDEILVVDCMPVTKDVKTIYSAHKASAVVLEVVQWKDCIENVKGSVRELRLADANVLGFVLKSDC